jgi:hypothetical protein
MSVIKTVPAYRDFEPTPIALSEFVERWLPGLENDRVHCGLNWSGKKATGYDLPPADVMARFAAVQRQS